MLNPTTDNKLNFTKYRNILTSILRQAEANYYKELISAENNNLKALWGIFGNVRNPQKLKKKNIINKLIVNDKTISSNNAIAETLNDHYTSIGAKLASNIRNPDSHRQYLLMPNENSFFLSPTTADEVLTHIKKLNGKNLVDMIIFHQNCCNSMQTYFPNT